MKAILTSMVLASASAFAQQAAPEPSLKPGSDMSLEPLASVTWVQGGPLTEFEPGKVYIFECWATWCGPCIAAIPHVNGLYQKYHDKGLRIYGMNVWEDGLDKVEKFVKSRGEGMSYPVAYTGKGSAFETGWLKAAGVRGIPHAFVVKDGKFLFSSHPARITDETVEKLLAGDASPEQIVADMEKAAAEAKKNQSPVPGLIRDISAARRAKDVETMKAKVAEYEEVAPNGAFLELARIDLAILQEDWAKATELVEATGGRTTSGMTIMQLSGKVAADGEGYPVEFIQSLIPKFDECVLKDPRMAKNPTVFTTLSGLQWAANDHEAAIATAGKAVELASQPEGKAYLVPPFQEFQTSMKEGKLMKPSELYASLRAASAAAKAEKEAAEGSTPEEEKEAAGTPSAG